MINSYVWADELYHHGTHGQKWGLRRYQNEDGSLTALGRIHYGIGKMREKHAEKKAANEVKRKEGLEKSALRGSGRAMRKASAMLSDEELKQRTARLNLEKQYKEAIRNNQGGLAYEIRHMTSSIVKKALADAGVDAIKKVIGVGTDKLVDSVKMAVNNAKENDLSPKKENNQKQQPNNSQKKENTQTQQPNNSKKKENDQKQQNKQKQSDDSQKKGNNKQTDSAQKKQANKDQKSKPTVFSDEERRHAEVIVRQTLAKKNNEPVYGLSNVVAQKQPDFNYARRMTNEVLFENGLHQFNRKR